MKKLYFFVFIFFVVTSLVFSQQRNIGDRGPAGGFIFFDKGNNSGGWRYMGDFRTNVYWTSSDAGFLMAWGVAPWAQSQHAREQSGILVRAIRAF